MSYDATSPETLTDPVAWMKAELDAAATDQEPGAKAVAREVSSRLAPFMGSTYTPWSVASPSQAQEASDMAGQICANHCEINDRCIEAACPIWRIETLADEYLAGNTDWITEEQQP